MRSLSETVATLEARRAALTRELAAIEIRLAAISKAVAGQAGSASPSGSKRSARGSGAQKARRTAKRVWFEKNEIGKLLRKAARQPSAVADIVRELARMKGYATTLSTDEMRRFQGAAFMAVAQGVKSKVLKRRADGTVVAA